MTATKPAAADVVEIRSNRVRDTFQLDPIVRITLKGKSYTMEMNNWAVKGILLDTECNLMSTGFTLDMMTDPAKMGSMLYWSLRTHQPDITQEDVDKLFTFRHYPYVLDRLKTAITLFLPDMSDIESDEALGRTEENINPQ